MSGVLDWTIPVLMPKREQVLGCHELEVFDQVLLSFDFKVERQVAVMLDGSETGLCNSCEQAGIRR